MKTKTNNLRYNATKTKGTKTIDVKIRLNDECKNGHQDFSITGTLYEANKPKIDKYMISGGCIHEEIIKFFPEFQIFVNLHLCDYKGIPMYCIANGLYHLTEGFNSVKPEQTGFKDMFCEYYRISPAQFEVLKTSTNKIQYTLNLKKLGVFEQWEKEANEAIKQLEALIGDEVFIVDSKRTQFDEPTKEEFKEEEERQANGYYTPEAEAQTVQEYFNKTIAELEAEAQKDIDKANLKLTVKKAVLIAGGEKALDNCIFYTHTNELAFNWKSYDNITPELLEQVKAKIILPAGVQIKVGK